MRDQRRVVVRQDGAVVLEEVQEVRHQLEVGRDVGVVPEEVHIVEADLNDMLDAVAKAALVALAALIVAASRRASRRQYLGSPADHAKRAEIRADHLRIEVEDAGGPWRDGPRDDSRPHGFDVVTAIAGPGNWGVDGDARGRTAWATLGG